MADVQHSSFQHADVHEPRWISINGTGANGNVITNSGSTTGISQYRRLGFDDIDNKVDTLQVKEFDSSVLQTSYTVAGFDGQITDWIAVVSNPLVTGSNTYELRINGVQVTGTPITFTTTAGSGGTAGDTQSATASGANTFESGDVITVVCTSNANTDATVDTTFVINVSRN